MRRFFTSALLLLSATSSLAAADLAVYFGYWGQAPDGKATVELIQPNYFQIALGRPLTGTGLKFVADAEPVISRENVVSVVATDVTRLPSGGSVVSIKLAPPAQTQLARMYAEWIKSADPKRNLLLVSSGRVLMVLELGQIWFAEGNLLFMVGSKSEGRMLEQAVRQ
jgi:hypothetical protein